MIGTFRAIVLSMRAYSWVFIFLSCNLHKIAQQSDELMIGALSSLVLFLTTKPGVIIIGTKTKTQ
jgi:hypothetical protein